MIEVNDSVLKQINDSFVIPPRPQLLADIKALSEQDEPLLADVADVISKDVAISAAILKVINSPLFGLSRTVSDIRQAVMFLGLEGAFSLVQGLKLRESFDPSKSCISLERFWDNAQNIADVCMFIGDRVKSQVPIEHLYTLGLFHDCGIPPMAIKYGNYIKILDYANNHPVHSLPKIEDKKYNTNHTVIGYYLSSRWHLPKDICNLILSHHDTNYLSRLSGSIDQISYAVLKMADNLVEETKRHGQSRDWIHVKAACFDVLGMCEDDYIDIRDDIESIYNT